MSLQTGDSDLQAPEISGIELGEPLGQGTFGEVFEAIELQASYRRVAVKILRDDAPGRSRFLEEMQILAEFQHPHLASLLSSGTTNDGRPYYVMELIEGQNLDDWSADHSLAEKLTVHRQITSAVAYAHSQGIAHRDLKPANILITKNNEAKVIDFGIARAFSGPASWNRESTLADQRMGTPEWMSPEQLSGQPDIDARADVWSLGLLLYNLVLDRFITSDLISPDKSWEENTQALRTFIFPRLPDDELDWIARKATSIERTERYPDGSALLADLEAREAGQPVSAGLSYRSYRLRKAFSRHRLGIITTIIAALILGFSAWWHHAREKNHQNSLAQADTREKAQLAQSLLAQSDAALLLGIRAMDQSDYADARSSLSQALTLAPENSAARFARNYLDSIHPLPLLLNDSPTDSATFTPTSLPFTDKANQIRLTSSQPGVLEVRDLASEELLFAPLIYGSGPEKIAWLSDQKIALVSNPDGTLKRWSFDALRAGFSKHHFSPFIVWLSFQHDSSTLSLLSLSADFYLWSTDAPPKQGGKYHAAHSSQTQWDTGECHHRMPPTPMTILLGFLQQKSWVESLGESGKIIAGAAASNHAYRHLIARGDGSIWLQEENKNFKEISTAHHSITSLAIQANGSSAAWVTGDNQVEVMNLDTVEITANWSLPAPARSISMLDSGLLVCAQANGTVTIWDPANPGAPIQEIPITLTPPPGFHIRSVPGADEFLICMDGDLAVRHYSALTGQPVGPAIRHQIGVDWLCFAGDSDILFSIDQGETGPGTLRIWSLRLGREIVPGITHPDLIHWVSLLENGSHLATACADGSVRRWIQPAKKNQAE